MLDMKFVRENLPAVQEMLKHRCNSLDLSSFTALEERRRTILQDVEETKARRCGARGQGDWRALYVLQGTRRTP